MNGEAGTEPEEGFSFLPTDMEEVILTPLR